MENIYIDEKIYVQYMLVHSFIYYLWKKKKTLFLILQFNAQLCLVGSAVI